ncbi:MAG: dipeptide epimerase [Chitinophagaceae bacterium]|jgi:L-alanine-DL-glutamate epimerase-like enolase superfamily enzyme|nr:dipeptide epimerase [Chitinophagaceae bacterium]OQY93315.1 MAG: dipeptide epimerase [Sphingobacteriales bacterium UTBCD1]
MPQKIIIQQIEIYKLFIPLKEPFVTSLGSEDEAASIVVVIRTDQGISGFGECSPYLPVNGESVDTCFIVGQYFAKVFKGKNALDIEERIADMDNIIYANSSIKSAFDIALYDIASQHAGVPLYKFIGGKNNKTIVTDYTVSIGDPDKMAADAVKIKNEGYPAIKVKLGKDGKTDVQRMKQIRKAVGYDIPLRIDANQGWKVKEAIDTLNALEELGIQYCEEPIARWKFMKLPKVRDNSPIPIMADESCGDHHDAERLIELEACDYFNIKLGKSGGIFNGLKIARLAEGAGMQMQVGAMLESRLGMSAFAHFSLCSPLIEHFDFDTALMFREDPVSGGIIYQKNGVIHITETPGLGATIDSSWLKKMEKAVI